MPAPCSQAHQLLSTGIGEIGPLDPIAAWQKWTDGKRTFWKPAFWTRNSEGQLGYWSQKKSYVRFGFEGEQGEDEWDGGYQRTFVPYSSQSSSFFRNINYENDCKMFAGIVDVLAGWATSTQDFMDRMVKRFIGSTMGANKDDFEKLGAVGDNEFGATGFKSQFVDTSNQVRHFVGGLLAGYLYGSIAGALGMNSRENNLVIGGNGVVRSGAGVLSWLLPAPDAVADIALNGESTALGTQLVPTPSYTVTDVNGRYKTTRTIPGNPGYKDLGKWIRNRICE
jgi:hypothetical protein